MASTVGHRWFFDVLIFLSGRNIAENHWSKRLGWRWIPITYSLVILSRKILLCIVYILYLVLHLDYKVVGLGVDTYSLVILSNPLIPQLYVCMYVCICIFGTVKLQELLPTFEHVIVL